MGISNTLTPRPLSELHPDPGNPRLPEGLPNLDDDALLVYIADNYDPLPIAESILRYGFWSSDPLIVTEEEGREVVLEGNRRLTALKGLIDPALRARFAAAKAWERAVGGGAPEVPEEVPVLVAESRADADALIGFRHIAGIQQWSPLQRARFIAHLIEERGLPFAEVAETVGEEESHVRLHYRNQDVLKVIASHGMEDVAVNGEELFGTFTAALNRVGLREFIGVPSVRDVTESGQHLDEDHLSEVAELFSWIYGTDEEQKVIKETRDLTYLADVVRDDKALEELRRTRNLDVAYALTGSAGKNVYTQLSMATGSLGSVVEKAELLQNEPRALERADEIEKLVASLRAALEDCAGDEG
jgi:hypothetical protein